MSGWVTLFDVSAEPFQWGDAGEGLVALAIVALGVGAAMAVRRRSRGVVALAALLALGSAGLYVERTVRHRREHARCVEAVRLGEGRLLEGVVSGYQRAEPGWNAANLVTFQVGGDRVSYPLLAEGCGLHQGALRDPSLLRDGARVRLRDWQGQILKVEVEQ